MSRAHYCIECDRYSIMAGTSYCQFCYDRLMRDRLKDNFVGSLLDEFSEGTLNHCDKEALVIEILGEALYSLKLEIDEIKSEFIKLKED